MNRFALPVLTILVISFTGFHDHNGNGQMDAGESYAAGVYQLHRIADDGAVSLVVVRYPPGVPYVLDLEPGDRVTAISGCGEWEVDASARAVGVPVICGSVFLPYVRLPSP